MNDEKRWQAVLSRDENLDGRFVYAVHSTGIYCRPSCPSRRPKRTRVAFFEFAEMAENEGFRPCRRCKPNQPVMDPRLERVREAIRLIGARIEEPFTLAELGKCVGASPYHIQRAFKKALGITPRQYADALRLRQLKKALRNGDSLTDSIYDAGYGSPSRLYERSDAFLGMTPATYRKGGAGAEIAYAIVRSPLGRLLVATTAKGICAVKLGDSDEALEAELQKEFPAATIRKDKKALQAPLEAALSHLEGKPPHLDLPLDVRATAFQRKVWTQLRTIPPGETRTYAEVARELGLDNGARAVASACASNPVALIVPCHRVVRADGSLAGYRWGVGRKQELIEREKEGRHIRK